MTQNDALSLNETQVAILRATAMSEIPIFIVALPTFRDTDEQRKELEKRNIDTQSLLAMGLIEDVSSEFRQPITDHFKRTGRRFKVFGLSEVGCLMFRDSIPESVN